MVSLDRVLSAADFTILPFEDATPLLLDAAALRRRAEALGYLYLRGLLPAPQVARVRAFVRAYCREQGWVRDAEGEPPVLHAATGARLTGRGWDDPRFVELQRRLCPAPAFQALGHASALLDVLALLMGRVPWMATANYCWLKFPGSPAQTTRPHQDRYYLPDTPRLWTAWVPLVDTPMDVGPIGIVPGSHLRGDWPHVDNLTGIDVAPDVVWATGPVAVGDVVLFGAHAVHCAWSNVSDILVRASLDIRYEPRPARGAATILRPVPSGRRTPPGRARRRHA